MWNININVTYYDYANIICELVVIRDCNNDAVLNKEECMLFLMWNFCLICTYLWILSVNKDCNKNNGIQNICLIFVFVDLGSE